MDYKNTIGAIYASLGELQNLVARMGAEGKLQAIELDLALTKMQSTYDLLLQLREESKSGKTDQRPEKEETTESKVEQATKPKTEQAKEVVFELKDKLEETVAEEPAKKEPAVEVKKPDKVEEKTLLAEKFSTQNPTLNEELSQKIEKEDIARKLQSKPITSITSAIGLNEKFELINTLFDGDSNQYEETMHTLNMAGNFNEAYNYLMETYDWNMDSPSVQRVLELIRRKLIVKKGDE